MDGPFLGCCTAHVTENMSLLPLFGLGIKRFSSYFATNLLNWFSMLRLVGKTPSNTFCISTSVGLQSVLDATVVEPKWPPPDGCCQGGNLTSCVSLRALSVVNIMKQQRFVCTRLCTSACICVCAAAVSNVMCGLQPFLGAV